MKNHGLTIALAIVLILVFACVLVNVLYNELSDRLVLDEKLHNAIEYMTEEGQEQQYIRYQDVLYFADEWDIIKATTTYEPENEDKLLSWNGFRFGYLDVFYSNKTESPVFIFETAHDVVYLREDYDYTSDIFVIEGTHLEVVFSDMFADFSNVQEHRDKDLPDIHLYSKKYPRLRVSFNLASSGGVWYLRTTYPHYQWKISDEFFELLSENGIS